MKLFPLSLAALALATAPSFAQQSDDTGNLISPNFGTTSTGGFYNGTGCGSGTSTTFYTANNGQAGNMFDIDVHGAAITLACLDIHTSALTTVNVEVWAVPGTCFGKDVGDLCVNGWVLVGTGSAVGMGTGVPTNVNLTDAVSGSPYVFNANSSYGLYVTLIASTALRYTNGAVINSGPYPGTHCDIRTYYGKAAYTPPCTLGSTFQPREWNGTLYTELVGPPPPSLSISGTCPGSVTISLANCTPGGALPLLMGPAGAFVKPSGACAGMTLGINPPSLLVVLTADGAGAASLSGNAPAGACGRTLQGVDASTCVPTNTAIL